MDSGVRAAAARDAVRGRRWSQRPLPRFDSTALQPRPTPLRRARERARHVAGVQALGILLFTLLGLSMYKLRHPPRLVSRPLAPLPPHLNHQPSALCPRPQHSCSLSTPLVLRPAIADLNLPPLPSMTSAPIPPPFPTPSLLTPHPHPPAQSSCNPADPTIFASRFPACGTLCQSDLRAYKNTCLPAVSRGCCRVCHHRSIISLPSAAFPRHHTHANGPFHLYCCHSPASCLVSLLSHQPVELISQPREGLSTQLSYIRPLVPPPFLPIHLLHFPACHTTQHKTCLDKTVVCYCSRLLRTLDASLLRCPVQSYPILSSYHLILSYRGPPVQNVSKPRPLSAKFRVE
jgi:hypothetical protein